MKELIYFSLNSLNVILRKRFKHHLRVLAYHTVPHPGNFEKQLKFLRNNFNIIDINQLKNHLRHGEVLPDNPVLITFDDGDISVLKNGVPILKDLKIPAVLFVITRLIDSEEMFWCRLVESNLQQEGRSYTEARKQVNFLKSVPEVQRRKFLKSLVPVKSEQISSDDLQNLSRIGILIGNHTHTHPMINNCSEAEIREELKAAKDKFKHWQLEGYSIFAYPNGNWDLKSEKVLKEEGIEMAFLFDHKVNKKEINPMRISRIRVNTFSPLQEFKAKVFGTHSWLLNLRSGKQRLETS